MSMHLTDRELGIVQVVLNDFKLHRISRLLTLKSNVDAGAELNEFDMQFLKDCINETKGGEEFAHKHPEFQTLVSEVSELYQHITEKALENGKC